MHSVQITLVMNDVTGFPCSYSLDNACKCMPIAILILSVYKMLEGDNKV